MDQEEAERLAKIIQREPWITCTHVVAHPTPKRYVIIGEHVVPHLFLYVKTPREWVRLKQAGTLWKRQRRESFFSSLKAMLFAVLSFFSSAITTVGPEPSHEWCATDLSARTQPSNERSNGSSL
jgi:hypothetical protein